MKLKRYFPPLLLTLILGLFAILLPMINATASAESVPDAVVAGESLYIVELEAPAIARYAGGIGALAPTTPELTQQRRLEQNDPAVVAYRDYLAQEQSMLLTRIEGETGRLIQPVHQYSYGFNGLTVALTAAEAATVATLPGVVAVVENELYLPLSDAGPEFVGADHMWDGSGRGMFDATMGEGVIIGVIDTGIANGHQAFAEVGPVDGYVHENPWGDDVYVGHCATTDPSFCNDKLIGFWDLVGDGVAASGLGHGTHVASIAAGNFYTTTLSGYDMTISMTLSGVAPHANLVAYDACNGNNQCPTYLIVAAIEQAIVDGVDVLNFSIGGVSVDPWRNPVTKAFLGARAAGIFVAAASGNSGPGSSINAGADAPWVLGVGNIRYDRVHSNSLIQMSGGDTTPPADMIGYGITGGTGLSPIVYAGDFDAANANCLQPFAAGTFANVDGSGIPAIVVCESGGSGSAKANNVAAGDAGGMVGLLADNWMYGWPYTGAPALRIHPDEGAALMTWLATGSGHMAAISGYERINDPSFGDHLYHNSSVGMNPSVPDVLKPDVVAPGFSVRAAAPNGATSLRNGTSMASPHAAGAAALLLSVHADWSPAETHSALMTTGIHETLTRSDWVTAANPFDVGGGRLQIPAAAAAGLIFDIDSTDYMEANPELGGDPAALNLPSLTRAACVETCGWTRTVRNPLGVATNWTAVIDAPSATVVTIPSGTSFSLAAGAEMSLAVDIDVSALASTTWMFGSIIWQEDNGLAPDVYMPIAVRPFEQHIPSYLSETVRRDAGSIPLNDMLVSSAISDLQVDLSGLTAAEIFTASLGGAPNNDPYDNLTDGATLYMTRTVPAGTSALIVEVLQSNSSNLDLYVGFDSNGDGLPSENEERCKRITLLSVERCLLDTPMAGTYWILAQNLNAALPAPNDMTMAVAVIPDSGSSLSWQGPSSVPAAEPFDVSILWDEPLPVGSVHYAHVSLGTSAAMAGDLGTVWLQLHRIEDDVSHSFSVPTATLSDTVTVSMTVAANPRWIDLDYTVEEMVPAGLTPLSGTVTGGGVLNGNMISWNGVMPRNGAVPHVITYQAMVNDINCQQPNDSTFVTVEAESITDNVGDQPATASDSLQIDNLSATCSPYIELAITLSDDGSCGTDSMFVSPSANDITYCYTMTNSSPVSVTVHTLTDDIWGTIFTDWADVVPPGASTSVTETHHVTASVVNSAQWVAAVELLGDSATADAMAYVMIGHQLYMPFALTEP